MINKNQENETVEKNKELKTLPVLSFFKYKNKLIILFILIIIIIGIPALTYGIVTVKSRIISAIQAKNEKLNLAFENNDYDTWYNMVEDKNITKTVTREVFSDYALVYKMLKSGDVDGANAIKISLGLKNSFVQESALSQARENAIKKGDYDGWRKYSEDLLPEVNRDTFPQYVKAYEAVSSGNIDRAAGFLRILNLKPNNFTSSR